MSQNIDPKLRRKDAALNFSNADDNLNLLRDYVSQIHDFERLLEIMYDTEFNSSADNVISDRIEQVLPKFLEDTGWSELIRLWERTEDNRLLKEPIAERMKQVLSTIHDQDEINNMLKASREIYASYPVGNGTVITVERLIKEHIDSLK